MMLVVIRVGIGLGSSRIVSCVADETSFVGEWAVFIESFLPTVAVPVDAVVVGGFRIAGSNPSNPAIKKKSANAATIIPCPLSSNFLLVQRSLLFGQPTSVCPCA
jgi:hypothetical protein